MLVSERIDKVATVQSMGSVPDVNGLATDIIAHAIEYCTQKGNLRDNKAALASLNAGDSAACQYSSYSIVRQVAGTLGAWDEHVQSVYVVDYDATPDDLCFACDGQSMPIHVIVWTARKTRALAALIAALDRALAACYQRMVCSDAPEHLLDVQVIDDAEVEGRIGYGAMLASIHQRPIQVWARQ